MTTQAGIAHRRLSPRGAERRGFRLARQSLAPELVERASSDDALRGDIEPLGTLMKAHVYPDAPARDAACLSARLSDFFELVPITASELEAPPRLDCWLAVGPRISDDGFSVVAEAVAGPEVDAVLATAHPAVITVAGVHYMLRFDGVRDLEVEAKDPFGVADRGEIAETAGWLIARAESNGRGAGAARPVVGRRGPAASR